MPRPGRNLSPEKKKRVSYYLPVKVASLMDEVHNKSQLIEQLIVNWAKTTNKPKGESK